MDVLLDLSVAGASEVVSGPWTPQAGAVSSTVLVASTEVDAVFAVEINLGGAVGWAGVVEGTATAGLVAKVNLRIPVLPHRVRVTPASESPTAIRALAGSLGVR